MSAHRGLSRRKFLQVGGATAAAAGTGAVFARPAVAKKAANDDYDAIVIGAGFAGATAARDLRDQGLNPLVLEARDRVGGRVWSSEWQGQEIELGGAWLHPNYHLTYQEMDRYGLGTVTDIATEELIMPRNGGFEVVGDPVAVGERIGVLMSQVFDGAEEYFPRPNEPLYRADLLESLDPLSLADRLAELAFSPEDLSLIHGPIATYAGGDAADGGLTALAQWWALSGWTAEGWGLMTAHRIAGGASSLVSAILNGADADVRLNSPVTSISDDGSGVTVTTGGGDSFTAPVAVVTVPVNVWRTIRFAPGLPTVHADATREGVGIRPASGKMWLRVTGDLKRVSAQGDAGDPISALFTHDYLPNGDSLIVANNGPGLDVTDLASVNAAVKRMLPGAEVVEGRVQDWVADPYSQGGWGMRRPGQMLRQLPAIHRPHGRITFASGDMPNGWIGSFEGAIETGSRAAAQAVALL